MGRLAELVQSRLWPLPTAAIVAGVVLGAVLPELDRAVVDDLPAWLRALLFTGSPDSARALLTSIAGSLITVTTLTFSLTVVALQLASTQASPRLLRMFASDRHVHVTLAVFLGTFAFALTVLRAVRSPDEQNGEGFVPGIAVGTAFGLTLASVVALTLFLAHLATRLRVDTMLRDVHAEARRTIAAVYDDEDGPGVGAPDAPDDAHDTLATRSGYLVGVDRADLLDLAEREDIVISLDAAVGGELVPRTPLARWWPHGPQRGVDDESIERIDRAVVGALLVDHERTPVQDVGFGIRQLVDVAVLALSPATADPTTAVHAIGHLSAVLGELVERPLPSAAERDDEGAVRVRVRRLDLAVTGPRRYGAADLDVALRLLRMLREVAWRSVHPHLAPGLTRRADEVLAAARTSERTATEIAALESARADVTAAIAGRWRPDGAA